MGCCFDEKREIPFRELGHGCQFSDAKLTDWNDKTYCEFHLPMSDEHAHHEQQMFYALEQKSRRHQVTTPLMEKLFSWLYEKTSNYGQSTGRPLLWILLVTYFSWCGYLGVEGASAGSAVRFAFQQLLRPFAIWGSLPEGGTEIHGAVLALATIQSILSLALITLFLLAIRRRFKLQ